MIAHRKEKAPATSSPGLRILITKSPFGLRPLGRRTRHRSRRGDLLHGARHARGLRGAVVGNELVDHKAGHDQGEDCQERQEPAAFIGPSFLLK